MAIFDFDDHHSIVNAVGKITEGWFILDSVYNILREQGETEKTEFLHYDDYRVDCIAKHTGGAAASFIGRFCAKCEQIDLAVLCHHYTRAKDKIPFINEGIKTLSESVCVEFIVESIDNIEGFHLSSLQQKQFLSYYYVNSNEWTNRRKHPGPYLYFSARGAFFENNKYINTGSEVWMDCYAHLEKFCQLNCIDFPDCGRNDWLSRLAEKRMPVVIRCAIPFAEITPPEYTISSILKSYFCLIDPSDEPEYCIEQGCVNYRGKVIDPSLILSVDELQP